MTVTAQPTLAPPVLAASIGFIGAQVPVPVEALPSAEPAASASEDKAPPAKKAPPRPIRRRHRPRRQQQDDTSTEDLTGDGF
jgi:hypothetical protein